MNEDVAGCTGVSIGCVGILALVVGFGAFFAWIAALLYNGILVSAFGFPPLTWLQMWGIIVLVNLVFGGLRSATTNNKQYTTLLA